MEFGELIKIYRKKSFFSQADLAQKTGLNQKSISDIEDGKVKTPQGKTIRILQEALNITKEEITSSLTNTIRQTKLEKLNNYKPQISTEKIEIIIPEISEKEVEMQILSMSGEVIGKYNVSNVTGSKFDFFLKTVKSYQEFFIEAGMLLGIRKENHCTEKDLIVIKNKTEEYIVKKFEEKDRENLIGKVVLKTTDLREI